MKETTKTLSWYQQQVRTLIRKSKVAGIVWLLQCLHNMRKYESIKFDLGCLPEGTVGKTIANTLYANGFDLIPGFESHDLKHILLGYSMTPEDEVRMQAFLLGNGNYSPVCFLFLSLGIFMPETWRSLVQEFRKGRKTPSILHLTIENSARENLEELRKKYRITL